MGELKACPFCGSEKIITDKDDKMAIDEKYIHIVGCFDCCSATGYCESKEDAIEAWNTRTKLTEDKQ